MNSCGSHFNIKPYFRLHRNDIRQVIIRKSQDSAIGLSIGGGAPHCPCIYVANVTKGMPAFNEGTIEPGDEILAINSLSVFGLRKTEVAQLIRRSGETVKIKIAKLEDHIVDDYCPIIAFKKLKHWIVENISEDSADFLGLSRAILSGDKLQAKIDNLYTTTKGIKAFQKNFTIYLGQLRQMVSIQKDFSILYAEMGCHDSIDSARSIYCKFSESHSALAKQGDDLIQKIQFLHKPLNTFLTRVVPDTKASLQSYLSVKFEYLSYCLQAKEMEDEDCSLQCDFDNTFRMECGNFEYRAVLKKCLQTKRKFNEQRAKILAKLELLDHKFVQDFMAFIKKWNVNMNNYFKASTEILKNRPNANIYDPTDSIPIANDH